MAEEDHRRREELPEQVAVSLAPPDELLRALEAALLAWASGQDEDLWTQAEQDQAPPP